MESFKNQFGLTYRLLLDSQRKVWRDYGMGYIPHNVVISPDWVVRYTHYGYNKAALIQTIEQWLPQTNVEGEESGKTPRQFSLSAAYPNPFVPLERAGRVRLQLHVPSGQRVEVAVFDVRGRKIRSLVSGRLSGAQTTVTWDGLDQRGESVPAGIYWIRARSGDRVIARRVVVLR